MKKNNWLDKYADSGTENGQPAIIRDFEQYSKSPQGQEYFKMMHDTQRAKDISGRIDYSDIDPITDLALPLVGIAGTIGKQAIKQGAKKLGKYLTEETALKNTHKINPFAFKPNPEAYYRGIGRTGLDDALESGVLRPKQGGTSSLHESINPITGEVKTFSLGKTFDKTYYSPKFEIADQYGKGYIVEVPKDASDFYKRYGDKNWSWLTKEQIPIDRGKIYKKDWLRGYKEIPRQENGGELNYNDSKVFIPEGMVGMSNNTQGRNWSPAWGGQFKKGGELKSWNPELAKKDDKFIDWYNNNTFEAKEGKPYNSPDSVYDFYSYFKNTPKEELSNPEKHFPDTYKLPNHPTFSNESIYSTPENTGGSWEGETFSPKGKFQFAMGGSIPGSVGFTYARTINPAPSEGKYAKKTMPSAENGQEMKFYQEGLDWKPKTISKNGGWLEKYKDGGELTKLDQLTNFSGYDKSIRGGWLNKYS